MILYLESMADIEQVHLNILDKVTGASCNLAVLGPVKRGPLRDKSYSTTVKLTTSCSYYDLIYMTVKRDETSESNSHERTTQGTRPAVGFCLGAYMWAAKSNIL